MARMVLALLIVAIPATAAMGQGVSIFTNLDTFEAAATDAGKVLKGIEDFEESNVPPGGIAGPLPDPLGSAPNEAFPNGLAFGNIQLQSNLLGTNATDAVPGSGLIVLGAGFIGSHTTVVGANTFVESTDMVFPDGDKTAIGFNVITNGGPSVQISVFDTGGSQIFQDVITAGANDSSFVGLVSSSAIGRINVADLTDFGELVDNIRMYVVPEPATFGLLAIAGLAMLRRRR